MEPRSRVVGAIVLRWQPAARSTNLLRLPSRVIRGPRLCSMCFEASSTTTASFPSGGVIADAVGNI